MIPQSLTSPPFLKNEFSDGSDKIFTKYSNSAVKEPRKTVTDESEKSMVQWKQKNIKDGFVIVDEAQLSKLIKRKPIEKFYKLEKEPFATGVFASVRRCQSLETGESYAAKFTSRDRYGEDCSAEIYHEIALLSLCGSAPRVIQIHDVFETEKEIIIVMEYAPGGDLQTIIDENLVPFESDVMSFIRQTVEGLEYLHRRRIAHLDIKPQNIVMMGDYPNCEIKLCDFEISRVILDGKDIRELLGTPEYVAPEILHYDPITLAADMWSLGVTTYVLLTGFSPFGGDTDQETFCNISRAEVDFPEELFKDVSNEAIDFIKSLLIKNPKARLTASECLKHPWFRSKHEPKKIESDKLDELIINNVKEEEKEEEEETSQDGNGCETCREQKQNAVVESDQEADKALRKYLSKSREALFEKVVQKHNTNNNVNNRKNTIKNYRFRKNRLCKSQYSLISKSQEKLLAGETFNAPSRSIEKLYGLRSLSKSQEVLNLYKNGGLLASQENLNMVSELIKSRENLLTGHDEEGFKEKKLTRATTADLSILHPRHKPLRMYSCSSTISLSSYIQNPTEQENDSAFELECKSETNETETKKENRNIEREKKKEKDEEKWSGIKDIEKLEKKINSVRKAEDEGDEDEPRFTVAQLITAYNKHQEIVTKTSLEVTMSSQEKETKIPPLIQYKTKSSFPTGPTALRLFIPDIDLVELPKKLVPKHKMRFQEAIEEIKERSPSPRETKDSSLQYLNLNSIISSNESISVTPAEEQLRTSQREIKAKKGEGQQCEEKRQHLIPGNTHRRSKSSSPNVEIIRVDPIPKINSTGNLANQKCDDLLKKRSPTPSRKSSSGKLHEKSPNFSRKSLSVEKSPGVQRKTVPKATKPTENVCKRGESWNYKIVGYGEKNLNSNRKSSGISYKIEFDSPVVTRKFPIRNIPTKGTISSNLKVKETRNKMKKPS